MSLVSNSVVLTKVVGTGNDFLFIDARKASEPLKGGFSEISRAELARKVCDRNIGIGADGLIFVEDGTSGADLRWDFYNNDGSFAEMCGNASRCMGRWAQIKLGRDSVSFDTMAGRVRTQVAGSKIEAHIDYLQIQFKELEFEVGAQKLSAVFLNTGVPHAVFEVVNIRDARHSQAVIQALRFHPDVGPRGTNVTFLQRGGGEKLEAATVTFERGVEDFTLSCGTGVMAAAAVGLRSDLAKDPAKDSAKDSGAELNSPRSIQLSTPGGHLEVTYAKGWSGAVLTGPAIFLFDVSLDETFLNQ